MPVPADLSQALDRTAEWGVRQFKHGTIRSAAEHLRREAAELEAAPNDAEEMADVAILAYQVLYRVRTHAVRHGADLTIAVYDKHDKNVNRAWGEPDADGVYEHIDPDRLERC